MKIFYFYFSDNSLLNEVTTVYVKTLEDAIRKLGYDVTYTYDYKSIPKKSKILTITDKCNFKVLTRCDPKICINWYQGIVPEEAALTFENSVSKYPRMLLHNFLEKYTLKRNTLNIFVSKSMKDHYEYKYGLKIEDYFIMPCFNCDFDENSFTSNRYKSPTFVYAGSLAKWQCVEHMLKAYSKLKTIIPDARMSVFTSQQIEAKKISEKYGVDIDIDYVSPEKLNERLKQFKYGLLFRENINVNNVATPTKINNYMACGLIPVFSDVIDDYRDISRHNAYVLTFDGEGDFVKKVSDMERKEIDEKKIFSAHQNTFSKYWNIMRYEEAFKEKLSKLID